MNYEKIWKKILNPNEHVKYEFSIAKKYRLFCTFLGCLAGAVILFTPGYYVGILIIVISIFYFNYFLKWSNAYAFTDKRVVIYRGWASSELISIDYDKITDIAVEQLIWEKFFTNTGNLVVNTAGVGFPDLKLEQKLESIEDPYKTKKKLDEIRESSKS